MKTQRGATTFLVIHGIGQQHPFETLNGFASALWNVLEQQNDGAKLKGEM